MFGTDLLPITSPVCQLLCFFCVSFSFLSRYPDILDSSNAIFLPNIITSTLISPFKFICHLLLTIVLDRLRWDNLLTRSLNYCRTQKDAFSSLYPVFSLWILSWSTLQSRPFPFPTFFMMYYVISRWSWMNWFMVADICT